MNILNKAEICSELECTEQQYQLLIDRWHEPLRYPNSSITYKVNGAKTYSEYLRMRLRDLQKAIEKYVEEESLTLARREEKEILFNGWHRYGYELTRDLFTDLCRFGFDKVTPRISSWISDGYDFRGADLRDLTFTGCKLGSADFSLANCTNTSFTFALLIKSKFIGTVFNRANFSYVSAADSIFNHSHADRAILEDASFFDADFASSQLFSSSFARSKMVKCDFSYCSLSTVNFSEVNFREAEFLGTSFWNTSLTKTDLSSCDLSQVSRFMKVDLLDCRMNPTTKFPIPIPEDIKIHESPWYRYQKLNRLIDSMYDTKFLSIVDMYKQLYLLHRKNGYYKEASEYHYCFSRAALIHKRRLSDRSASRKVWDHLLFAVNGHGERPMWLLLWMLLTILLYGLVYYGLSSDTLSYVDATYYSVTVFFTLGSGSYYPVSFLCRLLTSIEACTGVVLYSLFAVTLARRVIRE